MPDLSSEFNRPMLFSTRQDPDINLYGGGKNPKHANQDARISARDKYEAANLEFKKLYSVPNKTKEQYEQLKKLERQMKHWKRKKDFTGENHSQNPKVTLPKISTTF